MTLVLNAAKKIDWNETVAAGAETQTVHFGPDPDGLGGAQVAVAEVASKPSRETMLALYGARAGKRAIPTLVIAAVTGDRVSLLGPDPKAEIIADLSIDQARRLLQAALDEPDALSAYQRIGSLRKALASTSIAGFTNNGLFASYHMRTNVPQRADWAASATDAAPLLSKRGRQLIEALGFHATKGSGSALVLSGQTPASRAVAVLLDESEHFDRTSPSYQLSPVAFGLKVAAQHDVPWLLVLRQDQIRLYPGRDGIGVGQKGQTETFFEIDLAAIDAEYCALLPLVFSAGALEPDGSAQQILDGSGRYAAALGVRLRERIYEGVVPTLSKAVAAQLPKLGVAVDADGLTLAYRLTLRILFRLLFQAYAEDRGLLPSGRNERYDANSLKTIGQRDLDTPHDAFSEDATSIWFDLVQVWNAIDRGNALWDVPAYNGGLFGVDPVRHPEGALIAKLALTDSVLGPALQRLLVDVTEDEVRGLVDFRSLSVREFGTIYEGLLESSLSLTEVNLTTDKNGAWVPAKGDESVEAAAGTVYFHSASGERKATGSYFTPALIVDHLISRSITPTLERHLDKIAGYLREGDQSRASREFFDFRVADLAMGSGHFLVAAVDRIEALMRTFLTDHDVPGVKQELLRLEQAAKSALGKDATAQAEVEAIGLLRRQVARRCIYGVDINPISVELARLALWIHTFVPGLPMSSLDHGLVCANSLTGIGTIEEATAALEPNRIGSQGTFLDDVIHSSLAEAKRLLIDVANASEANKAEVEQTVELMAQVNASAERTRLIFDAALAARIGAVATGGIFTEEELDAHVAAPEIALAVDPLQPAHMPYLFPEVFVREDPGFDVLIGNPPWEELMVEEPKFWLRVRPGLLGLTPAKMKAEIKELRAERPDLVIELGKETDLVARMRKVLLTGPYPGLGTGDIDLYQAFAWRNWQLLKERGRLSMVVPRSLMNSAGGAAWRLTALGKTQSEIVALTNTGNWIFEGVDGRYSVALATVEKSNQSDGEIDIAGPFYSAVEFLAGREQLGRINFSVLLSASTGAALPQLPDAKAVDVFSQLRKSRRLDDCSPGWDFRPVSEFHATNDRPTFDSGEGPGDERLPVLGGAGFNIWEPQTGEVYAWAEPEKVVSALKAKRRNQARMKSSAFAGTRQEILDDEKSLPLFGARIAFRDVCRSTDTRTVIAALIPPHAVLINSAPYLLDRVENPRTQAYLLGILSSVPLDWYARRYVELHLNLHIFNGLPIPRIDSRPNLAARVTEIAGRLAARDTRFEAWAIAVGVDVEAVPEKERESLIAELDAIVSLLYGLSEEQVEHVFATFHRGWDYAPRLAAVLEHYRAWKNKA